MIETLISSSINAKKTRGLILSLSQIKSNENTDVSERSFIIKKTCRP